MNDKNILYLSKGGKNIYLVDEDDSLVKKILKYLQNTFPDYLFCPLKTLDELKIKIQEARPALIISALNFSTGQTAIDIVEHIHGDELTTKIPIIITAPRGDLDNIKDTIQRNGVYGVPKAIRIPFLLETVERALKDGSSVNVAVRTLKAGEFLFKEGEEATSIYVLISGKLLVFKEINGEQININEISKRQLIGEMAFLSRELRSASVKAINDTDVMELKLGEINSYINNQPYWLKMMLTTLTSRLQEADRRIIDLTRRHK